MLHATNDDIKTRNQSTPWHTDEEKQRLWTSGQCGGKYFWTILLSTGTTARISSIDKISVSIILALVKN